MGKGFGDKLSCDIVTHSSSVFAQFSVQCDTKLEVLFTKYIYEKDDFEHMLASRHCKILQDCLPHFC